MLSLARLPKNVGSAREAFINWIVPVLHFLAVLASFIKHYAARRCRRIKASNMLARRLQRNAANVMNPGVGRLRRAEAGSGGRTMGARVGPLFLAHQHGNKPGKSATGV